MLQGYEFGQSSGEGGKIGSESPYGAGYGDGCFYYVDHYCRTYITEHFYGQAQSMSAQEFWKNEYRKPMEKALSEVLNTK